MASRRKTVCIVGSGPGGLIAASKLFQVKGFDVTIFEKAANIGGLWSSEGLINPGMRTNLCQFTVGFSGLSWDTVDLSIPTPMYPLASHVRAYLQEFYRRYIPKDAIQFNSNVIKAELVNSKTGHEGSQVWRLETVSDSSSPPMHTEHLFDYLIVAPGQFSHPELPGDILTAEVQTSSVPVLHSTQYRQVADILKERSFDRNRGGKILVVGGSHSGSEAATNIALELSSFPNSALPPFEIVHVSSRRMISMPRFLRGGGAEDSNRLVEPFDLKFYNRSNLPKESSPSFTYQLFDAETHRATAKGLESILPGDEQLSDFEHGNLRLNAVINDSYSLLVQNGDIKLVHGSLTQLCPTSNGKFLQSSIHTTKDEEVEMDDIVAVVYATGFNANASISFLSEAIKQKLEHDPQPHHHLPLLLDGSYFAQNAAVPSLAVMGFAAQCWGAMEMQARAVAAFWTTGTMYPPAEGRASLATYYRELRSASSSGKHIKLPPSYFADYMGLMEQAARELGLERVDGEWNASEGPICAARYVDPGAAAAAERTEAEKTIMALQRVHARTRDSRLFVARAVFDALGGRWVSGGAAACGAETSAEAHKMEFRKRFSGDAACGLEYLVSEWGPSGCTRTLYRYREVGDEITIWRAGENGSLGAQGPLATLEFSRGLAHSGEGDLERARLVFLETASGRRERSEGNMFLCFHFNGIRLRRMEKERQHVDGAFETETVWCRPDGSLSH